MPHDAPVTSAIRPANLPMISSLVSLLLTCGRSLATASRRCGASLLAHMFAHQLFDDARIRKRRDVPQLVLLVGRDLAQNTPHDLARASFWQPGRPLDRVGGCNRPDLPPNPISQLHPQWLRGLDSGDQGHVYINALALDVVRKPDHRSLRDIGMRYQSTFDSGGSQSMAGHVDHIVDPAGDPVIAVGVAARAVAREIHAGKGLEVGVHEALMVAVDGAHLPRPAVQKHEIALAGALEDTALVVHDRRLHA